MLKNCAKWVLLLLVSNFLAASLNGAGIKMTGLERGLLENDKYNELIYHNGMWNPDSGNRGKSVRTFVREMLLSPETLVFKCTTYKTEKCAERVVISIVLVNEAMGKHCVFIRHGGSQGYNQLVRCLSSLDIGSIEPHFEKKKDLEQATVEIKILPIGSWYRDAVTLFEIEPRVQDE